MSDPKSAWLDELSLLRDKEKAGDRSQTLDDQMRAAISQARIYGATWQQIGDAMGTSRQYVNKRFGPIG